MARPFRGREDGTPGAGSKNPPFGGKKSIFPGKPVMTGRGRHQKTLPDKRKHDQMPEPKKVIAMGAFVSSRGAYTRDTAFLKEEIYFPLEVFIIGCSPPPADPLGGVIKKQQTTRRKKGRRRKEGLSLELDD